MGRFKKWISIPDAYDELYRKEKRFPVWYRLDKEHPNCQNFHMEGLRSGLLASPQRIRVS